MISIAKLIRYKTKRGSTACCSMVLDTKDDEKTSLITTL